MASQLCCMSALLVMAAALLATVCGWSVAATGPSQYTFYFHNTVYNFTINNTYFTSLYNYPPPVNFTNTYNIGLFSTFEVPLTVGPSNTSASVGVANGFWLSDSQKTFILFHVFTATIDDGTYNGTLTIMGQIVESDTVRTLTVVGGTGDFLFAHGFAKNQLISIDFTTPPSWTLSFELQLYYY